MPGVEILNTTIHYKEVLPIGAIITIIALIVIPLITIFVGKVLDAEVVYHAETVYHAGIVLLLVGIAFASVTYITTRKPTDEIDYIEHEVLVDDSVSLTEFNDKYEIVSQKGKIYIVREKRND